MGIVLAVLFIPIVRKILYIIIKTTTAAFYGCGCFHLYLLRRFADQVNLL